MQKNRLEANEMQCTDRGTDLCGLAASSICHRCNRQICHNHTLNLPSNATVGRARMQSTCRSCTEAIVADLAHELDNVAMKLALAFQQTDYWSEHLMPEIAPPTQHP